MRNFNEIARKDVAYENIKSNEKPSSHPLSRKKTQRVKFTPPSFKRVKASITRVYTNDG